MYVVCICIYLHLTQTPLILLRIDAFMLLMHSNGVAQLKSTAAFKRKNNMNEITREKMYVKRHNG